MEIKKIYVCSFILYLHQLRLRDYFFDNQNKAPISPDDILNIFPIVKHIHMPTVDAAKAHRTAQTSIQKGVLNLSVFSLLCFFLSKRYMTLFGLTCRSSGSGPRATEGSSLPVW